MFNRIISLPHGEIPSKVHLKTYPNADWESAFYDAIKNSSKEFKDELYDIYFGHSFKWEWRGKKGVFGEVMGVEASPKQIDYLFKIQEEFNIPISLTINSLNYDPEIVLNSYVRKMFLEYIKSFYDRGLRICTISDVHLMSTGILQEAFPDMLWKNTVNHKVSSAQELVDYTALGYNLIQLDRSLNRNFEELKNIKRAADLKGVKTVLLVTEFCMPSCPFKTEHDLVQKDLMKEDNNYWDVFGGLSCNNWRDIKLIESNLKMPRIGTDMVITTKEMFNELMSYVDILKFSGRLAGSRFTRTSDWRYTWTTKSGGTATRPEFSCLKEVYDNNAMPIHEWAPNVRNISDSPSSYDEAKNSNPIKFWNSPKGKALGKVLTNCKNQCWDCHACERSMGYPDVDTILELGKNNRNLQIQYIDTTAIANRKRLGK